MTRALVAFVLAVVTLGAFAFSALFERPCAQVVGSGQLVAYTSERPSAWKSCAPLTYSCVGECNRGLAGPVQPGG